MTKSDLCTNPSCSSLDIGLCGAATRRSDTCRHIAKRKAALVRETNTDHDGLKVLQAIHAKIMDYAMIWATSPNHYRVDMYSDMAIGAMEAWKAAADIILTRPAAEKIWYEYQTMLDCGWEGIT